MRVLERDANRCCLERLLVDGDIGDRAGFRVDLDGARYREADARRHDAAGQRRARRADADGSDQPHLSKLDAATDLATGFGRPAAETRAAMARDHSGEGAA